MSNTNTSIFQKGILLIVLIYLLYVGKSFFMPLAVATILATLFLPMSRRLESWRLPRLLAGIVCLFVLLLVLGGVVALLAWEINEISNDFEMIKTRAITLFSNLQAYLFEQLGLSLKLQSQLIKDESPSLTLVAQKLANSFSYLISNFILVIVYMLLLLYYRRHLLQFFLKLAGSIRETKVEKTIHQAAHVSQSYLVGLSKMIVCLWVMYGIGFSALGIKNAIFFAILCGLLEIIPFIGNITGTALTLLMAAAQGSSAPILFGVLITYAAVQFIQGWVLEPLIVGSQVKINPLFTIVALVLGELMWGIPGIFLAIPLTAIVKTVCDQVELLKPFGFLMGEVGEATVKNSIVTRWRHLVKK